VYLQPTGGEAALTAAVTAVSTPGSPAYGKFLSVEQYRQRFAPGPTESTAVESWLAGFGLQVAGTGGNGRYVVAEGALSSAGRAFDVTFGIFIHNGQRLWASEQNASVPASVAPDVLGVVGLDQVSGAMAIAGSDAPPGGALPPPPEDIAPPCSSYYGQLTGGTTTGGQPLPPFHGADADDAVCGYGPAQLRDAYGVSASGLTGQGTTVAVVGAGASPTMVSDADAFFASEGDPAFATGQFAQFLPKGRFHLSALCQGDAFQEEAQDVEAVHAMAPMADIEYYASGGCSDLDFIDTLDRVVDDDTASVVSASWGDPESEVTTGIEKAYHEDFQQGALEGIGFFAASGDIGNGRLFTGRVQTDYPASDPDVTAVGGTSTAIGPAGHIEWQTAWGTQELRLSNNDRRWLPAGPFGGSGGGFSRLFTRPAYQVGVVPRGTPAGRAVPDVAMDADPTTAMLVGLTEQFAGGPAYGERRAFGTSLACPLMAGIEALATEAAQRRLGLVNPTIYSLARRHGADFTDVTDSHSKAGNVWPTYDTGVPGSGTTYFVFTFGHDLGLSAAPGWDDATGLGSPNRRYLTAFAGHS
jgi:subtilase family serine protease